METNDVNTQAAPDNVTDNDKELIDALVEDANTAETETPLAGMHNWVDFVNNQPEEFHYFVISDSSPTVVNGVYIGLRDQSCLSFENTEFKSAVHRYFRRADETCCAKPIHVDKYWLDCTFSVYEYLVSKDNYKLCNKITTPPDSIHVHWLSAPKMVTQHPKRYTGSMLLACCGIDYVIY